MSNLKNWIARKLGAAAEVEIDDATGLRLAVAALLVEVLRADDVVDPAERRQVVESLCAHLGLGADDGRELFTLAERRVDQAHDFYQFTSQVNRACSAEEKVQLVEQMWRVAAADSVIHKYEEHTIRRVADLLHVSHRDFIAAKLRAVDAAG